MIQRILLACSLLTLACSRFSAPQDVSSTEEPFVALCDTGVNPWVWPEAGPHTAPYNLPSAYSCRFFRDDDEGTAPKHWGYGQNPWTVEPCAYPPPAGKITMTWGSNVGGPADDHCIMLTVSQFVPEGDFDFHWMAGYGWRTKDAAGDHYFRSFNLGPGTRLMVSDLDRVTTTRTDPSEDWICQSDSHCHLYEGGLYGSEADHADSLTGIKPWSFWLSN